MERIINENVSFAEFETSLRNVAQQLSDAERPLLINIMLIRCIVPRLIQFMDKVLEEYDISSTAWSALMAMYSAESSVLPSELSRILDVTRTTVTRISNDLVNRGWIDRQEEPNDRRKVKLALTAAGKRFVETTSPELSKERNKLWEGFSEAETEQLEAMLKRLLHNLGD